MTRLAFDMSSYLKTALNTGKDTKDGQLIDFDDKQVLVNSAEYGYEIVTNMMLNTMNSVGLKPKDCLLVFEGLSSKSRRLLVDPTYKGKRDKRPPEFYVEFQRLREFIESQWLGMGAISMCQDYAEADDTLAYLAEHLEEDLIVGTRDHDLDALNTEDGTNPQGAKVETWNDGLRGVIKLDGEVFVHPAKYVTLYKALVGDSSDSIKGCPNFGPAKFQKLAETYGYDGLDEMIGMLEAGSLGPIHGAAEEMAGKKPAHPLLKQCVEHEVEIIKSWKLVKMYPQWVNTMKDPLKIQGGKITGKPMDPDNRLLEFYSTEWLVTADNYEDSYAWFEAHLKVTDEPTFDIETSTPETSDEWLAGRPKGKGFDKVDQFGSMLTGFSFTYGANNEFTMYVSVDHAQTNNITMSQARRLIELAARSGKHIVIHNNFFELCVLATQCDEDGTPWINLWEELGARGFLPNSLDTKMEASYVNENISNGLKFRSEHHLGYKQTSFAETTQMTGKPEELPKGGRLVEVLEERIDTIYSETDMLPDGSGPAFENVVVPTLVTRQYKMNELPASHVVAYGCDDTICTAALHNYFKLVMQIEHTWRVYLDVEIDASYQHAKNYIDGVPFSLEKMRELESIDDETWDKAWATVREYLMENGWDGTVPPVYTPHIDAKQIKEAYNIVVLGAGAGGGVEVEMDLDEGGESESATLDDEGDGGEEEKDPFMSTRTRTPAKLVVMLREMGHEVFASMVERCLAGDAIEFTQYVQSHFSGEPIFKISPKQMCHLLYDVMGLPVRVRNKPTAAMRAKGIKEGNRKADALAFEYALRECTPEQKKVIEAIKLMTMVRTRRSLYYVNYPHFVHWKDGRVHPSHNQCQTNTRRASASDPNVQQLPKHAKITGQPARFRETLVPHHENAVIVSLDFDSQELRVIADYSKDPNMVACYVGDNKKDMHALTGFGIFVKKKPDLAVGVTYEDFAIAAKTEDHPLHKVCKEFRALGKKVNFTTEFGAMAEKLGMTMLVPEDEAQTYIDAKEKNFPGVRIWKDATIAESKRNGFVCTKLGARRHLRDVYMGDDHWLKSKAERQSVNFKVQSSSAEMTKKAEGRMWRMGLVYKYDCVCFGPIHDEVVFSVNKDQLADFLRDAHWCMTQPYGDMTIPIESSISFGPSFGEQFEIGIRPTPEAIANGWAQIAKAKEKAAAAIAKAKESSSVVAA